MAAPTHILVPLDFSVPSDAALEYAIDLAETLGARIHLLHAFDDPYLAAASMPDVYGYVPDEWRTQALRRVEKELSERTRLVTASGREATAQVVAGSPAATIADYARINGIDLIVMGTHGRSGVMHLLIGSVAERVVRTAPCPVLVVRPPALEGKTAADTPRVA